MQRDSIYDIMKGIGILAVIAGHSVGQLTLIDVSMRKLIYSFHMPMFFIIAGYFYKENDNLWKELKKDYKRLVIPYITTSSAFLIYQMLTDNSFWYSYKYILIAILWGTGEMHTSTIWPNIPHIGAIWFLLALFWCRTIFNIIVIHTIKPYIVTIIVAILATFLDSYIINLPLCILPGLSAMSYYLIGHCISQFKINNLEIIICATCWIIHLLYSRIDMCICLYKCYPIDVLGTTFGAILVYIISKKLSYLSFSRYLSKLGQISLLILCFHTLENNIIKYDSIQFIHDNWIALFIFRATLCISLTSFWIVSFNYTKSIKNSI